MSVIQASSPLNLVRKVAIVTSASTPLGAQTCRTLLRHNCLVLGIDETPIPENEGLFSALGTHFQKLQISLRDDDALEHVMKHCKDRFWKEGIDILVTFGNDDSEVRFRKAIGGIMADSDGGVILNAINEADVDEAVDIVELSRSGGQINNVRANLVIVDSVSQEGWKDVLPTPEGAINEVKECINRFQSLTKEDTDIRKLNKGIADLFLYLVSRLGEQVNAAVVTATGEWRSI